MPNYADALGYLNELANEVDEPWFKMVCDLVGVEGVSVLDQHTLATLFAIYTDKASYLPTKSATGAAVATPSASSGDFLEELSGFTNFKLLASTLQVVFKKRITVIFGANGSGKSSLCESLKTLANPELPNRPLHNVRGTEIRPRHSATSSRAIQPHTRGQRPLATVQCRRQSNTSTRRSH